jgi:hypothetical protein
MRDGAVLGHTPFHESWRPSTGVEKLRLERDGYRSEPVEVPLERGLHVTLTLKKERAAARPRHKPAPPPSKWENDKPASPQKWDDSRKKEPVPI